MSQSEFLQSVLADTTKAGVYHMPQVAPDPLIEAAEADGHAVYRVNLANARSKDDMLAAIGKSLEFPDWFGHNLDALADCLNDFSWAPADGYVILLEHCDGIHGYAETDFVATLQTFESASNEWREQGIPFWCFVDMQADGINWLPDMA